ncbi:unnamed protein product [Mycena citricolor]|uniref:Uncharacterized protein n=1 Tax=Mycena citricolor TaxID=2018698 RepID=A0AAD2I0U1_9AGAR|nr:unnamed protein product [Mycena citricolor]
MFLVFSSLFRWPFLSLGSHFIFIFFFFSIFLASLVPTTHAVPTNHTIDDADPVVVYDNQLAGDRSGLDVLCPSEDNTGSVCHTAGQGGFTTATGYDWSQLINGTMKVIDGKITVPFVGGAVYVYFGNQDAVSCNILIDGNQVGTYTGNASTAARSVLGYQQVLTTGGQHTLTLVSAGLDSLINFDGIVFTQGLQKLASSSSSTATPTSASQIPTHRTSNPAASTPTQSISPAPLHRSILAPVLGAVAGILVIAALAIAVCVVRRRRRRRPIRRISNIDPEPASAFNPYPLNLPSTTAVKEPGGPREKPARTAVLTNPSARAAVAAAAPDTATVSMPAPPTGDSDLAVRLADVEARFRALEQSVQRRDTMHAPPPAYQ